MRSLIPTCLLAALLTGVAAPVRAQDGKIEQLEAKMLKYVDEATENLTKVQTRSMDFTVAVKKLDEWIKKGEELKELHEATGDKYLQELLSIKHWTRKFAPLVFEAPKEQPKPDPESPPTPDPSPQPAPDPDPAPQPEPGPTPAPSPAPSPSSTWQPPALPGDPKDWPGVVLPLLGDATPDARRWACAQVPYHPTQPLVDRLFELFLHDAAEPVRAAARDAISKTLHDAVFENFRGLVLTLEDPELTQLVDLIKEKPEPRSVAALFDLALRFVPPIGGADSTSKPAMETYKSRAKAAWEDGWRHRAIQIWRAWPNPMVTEGLALVWNEQKKRKRQGLKPMQEVLLAIGVIGNDRGIKYAVPFLSKGDEVAVPLRAPALAAIELVGKPAVPWLIGGIRNPRTQLWCWQALRNITGENRGMKAMAVKRWTQWWYENR